MHACTSDNLKPSL
uniref:Uncharacterized protein n=1 Tax=Arundo donax TaxID=35708 RepID=A0A0A9HFN3_ARUDO